MTRKPILYVFRRAPYGALSGREGLDALLVGAAFEQTLSVLFMDDGVYQIAGGQDTGGIDAKPYTRAFRALDDFIGEDAPPAALYVHSASLARRGMSVDDLAVPVTQVDDKEVQNLLADQHAVLNF